MVNATVHKERNQEPKKVQLAGESWSVAIVVNKNMA